MIRKIRTYLACAVLATAAGPTFAGSLDGDGIVTVKSAYPVAETIERIQKDVISKGITWFGIVDQANLGNAAGNEVLSSTLLMFGNPALGTSFVTASQTAGLDWPVRVLVYENAKGEVFAAYTDFAWIADRHGITTRDAEFAMATSVIQSVTASVLGD